MEIVISGAVANYSYISTQQLIDYLEERTEGLEYFQFQPKQGYVSSAAFDWKIIGNLADILGLASFLWTAYSELIKPNKIPESNSGIIIKVENAGNNNLFWIGNDINSKEELIRLFERELKNFDNDSSKLKEQINELKNSEVWKKTK